MQSISSFTHTSLPSLSSSLLPRERERTRVWYSTLLRVEQEYKEDQASSTKKIIFRISESGLVFFSAPFVLLIWFAVSIEFHLLAFLFLLVEQSLSFRLNSQIHYAFPHQSTATHSPSSSMEAEISHFRLLLLSLSLLLLLPFCFGIRTFRSGGYELGLSDFSRFAEAPEYRNGAECPASSGGETMSSCDPALVHIAMTLDSEYVRGSVAAIHSVLKHASCPENVFFHFIAAEFDPATPRELSKLVRSTFPSLSFKVYIFREDTVINLISSSIRQALENPLNYARNYLGDILDSCVDRVIYLDSDVVVVDDIHKLWNIKLSGSRVIGAPEYCHANFTKYFTHKFWSDPVLSRVFTSRTPCYFNTGVMVMDLSRWRAGNYKKKIESWMELQKRTRIYDLGSLPPFLLVFAGNVEPIDHRWNQHGLGGDNVKDSCRTLHPGPVSLLHWSGKGKPWVRLDANKPCLLDHLWKPYDLYKLPHHENRAQDPASASPTPSSSSYSSTLISYLSY